MQGLSEEERHISLIRKLDALLSITTEVHRPVISRRFDSWWFSIDKISHSLLHTMKFFEAQYFVNQKKLFQKLLFWVLEPISGKKWESKVHRTWKRWNRALIESETKFFEVQVTMIWFWRIFLNYGNILFQMILCEQYFSFFLFVLRRLKSRHFFLDVVDCLNNQQHLYWEQTPRSPRRHLLRDTRQRVL